MQATPDARYAAFVGIAWAARTHDGCLPPAGCDTREFRVLAHRPESLQQWAEGLRPRVQGRPIAVCWEWTQGPRVAALQRYEFLGRFPVNPTMRAQ